MKFIKIFSIISIIISLVLLLKKEWPKIKKEFPCDGKTCTGASDCCKRSPYCTGYNKCSSSPGNRTTCSDTTKPCDGDEQCIGEQCFKDCTSDEDCTNYAPMCANDNTCKNYKDGYTRCSLATGE